NLEKPGQATQGHHKATLRPYTRHRLRSTKPPQGHTKATLKPTDSQPIGTPKPPQGYPKATPRLHQGHPKARYKPSDVGERNVQGGFPAFGPHWESGSATAGTQRRGGDFPPCQAGAVAVRLMQALASIRC